MNGDVISLDDFPHHLDWKLDAQAADDSASCLHGLDPETAEWVISRGRGENTVSDMDEDDIFLMRLLDGETDSPSPGSSGTPVDPDDDVARDPDWTEDDEDEESVAHGRPRRRCRDIGEDKDVRVLPRIKISCWLELLLSNEDYNPAVIKWENRSQGLFKLTNQDEIGRLWGKVKNNQRMTYEKFSRAMRYYYKRGELEPVRKKLYFKFGPKAPFWKN